MRPRVEVKSVREELHTNQRVDKDKEAHKKHEIDAALQRSDHRLQQTVEPTPSSCELQETEHAERSESRNRTSRRAAAAKKAWRRENNLHYRNDDYKSVKRIKCVP